MKSIFKAVAVVTIFSIITRFLGFFFRIFMSRKLGALGMGLFQMASSILAIFMTLVSSGLPLTTAKLVSKYEAKNEIIKRNKAVSSALVISLVIAILSAIIICLLRSVWNIVLTDNKAVEILIILVPSVIFSAIYAVFRGALWGQNDYFSCGLTEFIEQILRFAITFILLINISDYFVATKNAAIAFNITCLLSALVTMFIYFKRCKLNFTFGEYKNVFKSALPITGVRLANSMVQPLTTIIIPSMLLISGYTKSEAVSSFGVIMGMTWPMLYVPMAIIGSISMVLIPSISAMMTKNEYDKIEQNISKSLTVSIFLSMIFVPIYIAVGDKIGIILYNNLMSGILLQYASFCILPISLCNLTGSILNALNLEVKSFINYLIGSAVLFVSLIALTPLLKINSVIISFFLSMTTITLLNLKKIKKAVPNLKFKFIKCSFKYSLISIPSSLFGYFIANISSKFMINLFSACLGGGASLICMLILIRVFNIFDFNELINLLKRKTKKSA